MFKPLSFFILIFLFNNRSFGQTDDEIKIITKCIKTAHSGNFASDYSLLFLKKNIPADKRNTIERRALRKFNDHIFVIENNSIDCNAKDTMYLKSFAMANNFWKLSSQVDLIKNDQRKSNIKFLFTIQFKFAQQIAEYFQLHNELNKNIVSSFSNIISIAVTYKEVEKLFLDEHDVIAIDVHIHSPKEELAVNGFDLSANKINTVHNNYPDINGTGQHVSIKENYYDTADIDLRGRFEFSPLASKIITNHANFIATIIAGADNSIYYAKGAAWGAFVSSSSFESLLPDPSDYYKEKNITVQNHSYGTDIDNTYGLNAVAFDKSANENPDLLHVVSSGNSGSSSSTNGNYKGITGYATITGNFKMAKDVLVVGGTDSFGVVAPLSSRGPAYDGRIKPDIAAFQLNGTSESAALVSGTILLLQQYYKHIYNNLSLPAALARAILINSADDVNNPGPDYATGFGNLNAEKAMEIIKNKTIISGQISQSDTQRFLIDIPAGISKVKISLCWNDSANKAFAEKALINDLDLSLTLATSHQTWLPWVLNPSPNVDSLNDLAKRKRDSLNNEEQVTVDNPAAGKYSINILGFSLPAGTQQYFIAYSFDTANNFLWYKPVKNEFLVAGKSCLLRWENSYNKKGRLEFSYTFSDGWNTVSDSVDLSKKNFYWSAPDTIAQVVFRMRIGDIYYYSDSIWINKSVNPKIGFVCGDSILLYWNRVHHIKNYEVYTLGNRYMQPFVQLSDTSLIISRSTLTNNYLAVSSILNSGRPGQRSYAFDFTTQGAGCFINSFFADAHNNAALLSLTLGTTHQVANINFEKLTPAGFVTVYTGTVHDSTQYNYNFSPLDVGLTFFRARITLISGQVIYSEKVSVFYVNPEQYLFFPIPVNRFKGVEILTAIPNGENIILTNVLGQKVLQKTIQSTHEFLNTSLINAGVYFYIIVKDGVQKASGKLIIE